MPQACRPVVARKFAVFSLQRALEGAIAANFADLAAHSAYADYLQEQGDPRGELIQMQLALEDATRPAEERQRLRQREKELLDAHLREWLGEIAYVLLDDESMVDEDRNIFHLDAIGPPYSQFPVRARLAGTG